jgi:hypothetical protein
VAWVRGRAATVMLPACAAIAKQLASCMHESYWPAACMSPTGQLHA